MPKGSALDRAISTPKGTRPPLNEPCSQVDTYRRSCLRTSTSPVLIPDPLGVTVNLTFDEGLSAIFSDRGPSEIKTLFKSVTVALCSFMSTVGLVSPLRSRWGDQPCPREVKGAAVSDLGLNKVSEMLRKISEFLAVRNLSSSAPNYQERLPSAVLTLCVGRVVVVFFNRGGAIFKLSPVVSELLDRDSGTCSLRCARRKNHPRFNPQRASCIHLFVYFFVSFLQLFSSFVFILFSTVQ